ncbi:MAG TPA: tetratricopeptide repeat protein, partial [Azospirillum sp.]
ETLGMLDVLQQNQPDLEGWPEFRALRGAARVLAGDLDGAREDLNHPGLANSAEAALWRGAIAAQQNDGPKAARDFKTGGPILAKYPDPLLSKLALLAAETALRAGDVNEGKRWLDRVEQKIGTEANERADMQYLRGEQYRQQGEVAHAREEMTAAFNSLDRYYRAKAGLALVNLEVAEGRMSPANAAEQLAGLTFTWRGDDLEIAIRQRLGEMQIAGGQYAEGFNTMKETAALVGDGPKAEQITKDMARTFADLYKDGASRLPTLEALQLYDQFRELTPVGTAGDEIIRQLAERLIQIDLLGKASDLLQHQVEYRLSGQDKASIGTRLASVRLLDNKPQEALKALELSNVPGIPADLQRERLVMQAKALAELGRGNEALLLLAQDDSKESNLLRVDIAWRAQNWGQAAVALGKIIGAPPAPGQPLDASASQLVLNRAVALALAGDGTGLSQLRKEFGTGMEKGPDADTFRLLTRPEQATGLIDVNTIRSRVAEVDVFQKFLKGYRSRTAGQAQDKKS